MTLKSHRVSAGNIELHVREAGSGPLIVFLHGITANAAVWDPVLVDLQSDFHVVAADQRGHGLSDKPAHGYGGEAYAHDLLGLIQTMGGGPAIVVGHSLGARNGVVAATLQPELIDGVVAIDFVPFIEDEVLVALETRVKGGDRTFASIDEIVAYLASRYPLMPPDALQRRAANGYRQVDDVFHALADPKAMAATAEGLREDLEPAMSSVRKPVLLVRGAESKLVSVAAFERTRRLRPDLPTLVVPGTDHYVPEEAPAVVSQAIRDFAKTLSSKPAA
jgi:2-(acetamidomethylene)succinate hydrolase